MVNGSVEFKSPERVTPEGAALALLQIIASVEGKSFELGGNADRAWIISTYRECLRAVQNP